jgi:hypothetical protein
MLRKRKIMFNIQNRIIRFVLEPFFHREGVKTALY